RKNIAKLESDGTYEKNKLNKLFIEEDSLDKRLSQVWMEYAKQKENMGITWKQVQSNLDTGEAAIEFVRFKNEIDSSLVYYNALVVKKGYDYPKLVKLCKEKEIESIRPESGFSDYYPLIWQPLDSILEDVKTIYYAPTGKLYDVPFHALCSAPDNNDKAITSNSKKRGVDLKNTESRSYDNAEFLIDRYNLHQLTSTRYLAMGLKQKSEDTISKSIAMVGGVNYEYLPNVNTPTNKSKRRKRESASRSSQFKNSRLDYLKGTQEEVEFIRDSLARNTWKMELFENNSATEDQLHRLEGKYGKSILHFATHGYAFPEYNYNKDTTDKNSYRYAYRYSVNPMVRSGIILAGGNWAWTGSDTLTRLGAEENGILSALEVSHLNLQKTKLVVLSACETGRGQIDISEGTFGLKRGFKLAGVEQMIVSLWSVPDKETMELMTIFYSELTKTLNPVNSFEKAQKEMRLKYPTDPAKWAGFVLVR
ncbi:MAG: CHAT domain-containing protein, partial [Bacteroidota bacterium]